MTAITQVLFLALAGLLAGSCHVIFKNLIAKKADSKILTVATFFISALLSIPFLFYQFKISSSLFIWVLIMFSVISYGYGMYFNYQAYKYADLSVIALIKRLSIVYVSIIGIIFLKEKHTVFSLLGIFFIFGGSLIVLYENKKININKGIIFALLIPIADTIATLLDKIILGSFSQYSYLFINNLLVSFVFIGQKNALKSSIQLTKKYPGQILLTSLFMVISAVLVWTVLKNNYASTTMPVYLSCGLLIQILFGILFFKETAKLKQKVLGTIIILLGIWLIFR